MDAGTYRRNCVQRAIEEQAEFVSNNEENNDFTCRSRASGKEYRVALYESEGWRCDCESGQYRGYCKHVAGLILWAQGRGVPLPREGKRMNLTIGGNPIGG